MKGLPRDDLEMEIGPIPDLFFPVLGERENGSVAPGKAGQNIKSFHASFQAVMEQQWNRAHVKRSGSFLTLMFALV